MLKTQHVQGLNEIELEHGREHAIGGSNGSSSSSGSNGIVANHNTNNQNLYTKNNDNNRCFELFMLQLKTTISCSSTKLPYSQGFWSRLYFAACNKMNVYRAISAKIH